MHNEQDNVDALHGALMGQTFKDFTWFVVDDGSTDQTAELLEAINREPVPRVARRVNDGGLIAGSAYGAWRFGIDFAQHATDGAAYTHVMKLDADVRLPPDYLSRVLEGMTDSVGIAGGVIVGRGHREQALHVPGPVKLYTWQAYEALSDLPSAIGFDVMDEVRAQQAGFVTKVLPDAKFTLARAIGASEGSLHGRYRNGRVCRWTGYDHLYFLLHALRYIARRPVAVGSIAMIVGYLSAGAGPYASNLRRAHRKLQRAKLRAAMQRPVGWFRETYRY